MAGIKNKYQVYGATPFDTVKGNSIQERHMNLLSREYTPYCQFCGGEIIDATMDENKNTVDPEWERLNQVHTRCLRERMMAF